MGASLATNLFMVGYGYQRGLIPVGEDAILRAIELNAASVEANKQSFRWGRLAAVEPERVLKLAIPEEKPGSQLISTSLEEIIARRAEFLTAYQDAAYAKRYTDFVAKVGALEAQKQPGSTALSEAVARYYFKLLAIKDEYEVARLYSAGDFAKRVAQQFEGDYRLVFHLAPPLATKADSGGEPKKKAYGPWMMSAFRVLAKMKTLRGTAFDIFGRTAERRQERQLITDYEALIEELLPQLAAHNHAIAVELAAIPEHIRGYGHVKHRHLKTAKAKEAELVAKYRGAKPPSVAQPVKVAA